MSNQHEYSMVISTSSSRESAMAIAECLIEKKLAACVQILPIESIYVWQGEVCKDSEAMMLIKTRTALFDELAGAIQDCHPYEVPEIVQIPIADGLPEYLKWIDGCVSQKGK